MSINVQDKIYMLEETAYESVRSSEAVLSTKNTTSEQITSVVKNLILTWGQKNSEHASDPYLRFITISFIKSAQHLLEKEIELAINEDWKEQYQLVWQGIQEALTNPPNGHPLETLGKEYNFALTRAEQSNYDEKTKFTLDITENNLDKTLGIEDCQGMPIEEAMIWLSHRIMIAASSDEANIFVKNFQVEFNGQTEYNIGMLSPKSLKEIRRDGIDVLHKKLNDRIKPIIENTEEIDINKKNLEDVLTGAGVFGNVKKAKNSVISTPDDIIDQLAQKHGIPVMDFETWKIQNKSRSKAYLIKKMDYKNVHQSIGRAQYVLTGGSENEDIRIELRNQKVSGSAGNKLPTTLYSLHKANEHAPYKEVIVGVANTTHFSEDALGLAELLSNMFPKITFHKGNELIKTIDKLMLDQVNSYKVPMKIPKEVVSLMGMEDTIVEYETVEKSPEPKSSNLVIEDDTFGV